MNTKKLIRLFKYSYQAKIISVILAIFIWIHVTAQNIEEQTFNVPLELAGIPDSFVVVNDIPDFVEITINEKRAKLIKLRFFGNIKGVVDLPSVRKGWINIPLSSNIIETSEDISRINLSVDNPKFVELNLQKVLAKDVPVRLAYNGEITEDRFIAGDPVIIPEKVLIRGASTIVEEIHFLSTNEIDIRNRTGVVKELVDLHAQDYKITVEPEKVLVELEICKLKSRKIANIPPTILMDNRNLEIKCSPPAASITVEGREEFVDEIVPSDISIILNINSVTTGTYTVKPEVIVPDRILRYRLDVDTFSVTVLPDSTAFGDED